MTLKITVASEEDAARISDIHMAAFGTNEMLLAQVPTEKARQGLRKCIARKAAGDIKDPRIDVLLVRDTKIDNQAIAYAKWSSPSSTSETETPWIWPDGTRHDILDEWIKILSEADVSIMGNEPCYRLAYIATHPDHQRRGAAKMLTDWGLDRCRKEKIPAYLESTPVAIAFYAKAGFVPVEKMKMTFQDGSIYEEWGCIFRP